MSALVGATGDMSAELFCPHCGGSGSIVYQDIALCECGVAYRTRPGLSDFQYRPSSFAGQIAEHRSRLKRIVERVHRLDQARSILDVGSGHGLLYDALIGAGVRPHRYVALEPAEPLAVELEQRDSIQVVRGSLNTLSDQERFDTIFALGVDYLFADINWSYIRMASLLSPGGTIVVQRNVFLDQTAYVGGRPFAKLSDLFGANPLIMQWFQLDQYVSFVSRFFSIVATFNDPQPGGGFVLTWIGAAGGSMGEVIRRPERACGILRRLGK